MALTLHRPAHTQTLPRPERARPTRTGGPSLPLALLISVFALPWLLLTRNLPPADEDE